MNKKKCFLSYLGSCQKSSILRSAPFCKKTWMTWGALGLVALVDRISKLWALRSCQETVSVTSWLQCDLVINRGVSFGLFHADNQWTFGTVTVFVIGLTVLVGLHAVMQARQGYSYLGELCIMIGSVSNLLDRFFNNGVIDFIVFKCSLGAWPAYNIADALIVSGVGILIITHYRER